MQRAEPQRHDTREAMHRCITAAPRVSPAVPPHEGGGGGDGGELRGPHPGVGKDAGLAFEGACSMRRDGITRQLGVVDDRARAEARRRL